MIDFDPDGTAAQLAADAARDAAFSNLVATVRTTPDDARAHGLPLPPDEHGQVHAWVCPACSGYEANEWLIGNNHGIRREHLEQRADGEWTTTGREYGRQWCIALDLTCTHVAGEHDLSERQTLMLERLTPEVRDRFTQEVESVRERIARRDHYLARIAHDTAQSAPRQECPTHELS